VRWLPATPDVIGPGPFSAPTRRNQAARLRKAQKRVAKRVREEEEALKHRRELLGISDFP
jgi:hypothetical protein